MGGVKRRGTEVCYGGRYVVLLFFFKKKEKKGRLVFYKR
jgi:hypothetical protein